MRNPLRRPRNSVISTAVAVFLLLWLVGSSFQSYGQADTDRDGIPDPTEQGLASQYAPRLQFAAGELFFPVDVIYHIRNSVLKQRVGDSSTVVESSPTITSISQRTLSDFYLDNTLGGSTEISADYQAKQNGLGYTVYARVTREGSNTIVQYWFFYAFNKGPLNDHEGDWETVLVVLGSSGAPLTASYSQHNGGEQAAWTDVDRVDGTHPTIYVARGSHANYFKPFQGKLGFENDEVSGAGKALSPGEYTLVLLGEPGVGNRPETQAWLDYGGRWGDWAERLDAQRGLAGPPGPTWQDNRPKWFSPVVWSSNLRQVDATWFTVSWIVANFVWLYLGIASLLAVIKGYRAYRRVRTGGLQITRILRSRAAVGLAVGLVGFVIGIVALFMPWYSVRGTVQTQALATPGEVDLLLVDGVSGVQVNTLQTGQGVSPLFSLLLPLGVIFVVSVFFTVLDLVGAESASKLGGKYVRGFITTLLPVVVILVFIVLLTNSLPALAQAAGLTDVPVEALSLARTVSSSPISGAASAVLGPYDNVSLTWGLSLGSYLFMAAAFLKLIGGVVMKTSREAPRPKAPPSPSPAQPQVKTRFCPYCGTKLTFIEKYEEYYCYTDKKYIPKELLATQA